MERSEICANGVTLSIVELGEGPPVLFCHGFPDTARVWRQQMIAVAAAGYRAIAFDMRGYGRSSSPSDEAEYTTLHTAGDVIAILDALDLPSAVLVGHDFGAYIAWATAVMRPDRIAAVFGISVPYVPRGEESFLDSLLRAGQHSFYMFDQMKSSADDVWADAARTIPSVLYWTSSSPEPANRWSPFDPTRGLMRRSPVAVPPWADPDYVSHNIAEFQRTGFHGALNYYRTLQRSFDLTAAFRGAKISQPSFFLMGQDDGLNELFSQTFEGLREDAPGLLDYVKLEGAGHWPQLEKSAIFNVILLEFLTKATSGYPGDENIPMS